jgi:N,N'-diacetylbacillosaminyl-diphospho-undecaprenol alpha-1,3-N-acetylgalactosaminyltransferase
LKIAIICPNDFSIVTFCGALVEFLQDGNKNTVYAVCGVHGAHGENTHGYYTNVMKSCGVLHLPVKYYRFLSARKDINYIFSLYKILRKEKFDMVINIATKANVYGSIVAKLIGTKKIVCSVWGLGVNFADNGGLKRKFLKILILYLYRLGFKLSSKVWFTNEYDYNWFVSDGIVGHEKAFLTKNYVNTDVYSPNSVTKEQILNLRKELGLKEKDKVVVMVARMSWAKGVKEFVEAASILRDKYPMVKFILVGPMDDGSSDSVPESYLRENEKYDNFIWTGFRKNVQAFYAVSDLAALPSYYREGGFPRGLTEAMSMGKPIITTDSVHCRATVEDGKNGYHVPIKDSKALANAIEKIITDDDKREKFGRYSRVKALNEFDERKVVSQVVQEIL